MKKRNDVKVVIGGKQYNMGGYESEEYLQSIASYINAKTEELKQQGGFPKLDSDIVNILLQINIADDYFKLRKNQDDIEREITEKQKETLEKFEDCMNEMHSITERDAFSYGFRLGVQLMAEAFLMPLGEDENL